MGYKEGERERSKTKGKGKEKEGKEEGKGATDLNGEGEKGLGERMVAPDQVEGREKEER